MNQDNISYFEKQHPRFYGNPFVESLPKRLNLEDFWNATVKDVELPEQLDRYDEEAKEEFARDIMDSVQPTSMYHGVYADVLALLKNGYKNRNPKDEKTQKWQHQVATNTFEQQKSTASSIILTGYSGMGKTTLIDSVLSQIPPIIHHQADGPLGFQCTQIVYIKVNIPGDADLKQICLAVIGEIDKIHGTEIRKSFEIKNRNTKDCISRLIALCTTHLVGMIIFDEIQNICLATPNAQKLVFTLFDRLANEAFVPTIKIGTTKANRLINNEFTNSRRLGASIEMLNFQREDEDWLLLVEYAWSQQLLPKKRSLTKADQELIYSYTQGIPYCLFFLIEQSNILGLRHGYHSFNKTLFGEVYRAKFRLMRPAITALRLGKTQAFDDLFFINNQVNQDSKVIIKKLLKIAHDSKLKGQPAKQLREEFDKYLPEYELTAKEKAIIKQLDKSSELVVSGLEEVDGKYRLPI